MSWQSYVIPVVSSSVLMCGCWLIGCYGLSFVWVLGFIVLYVLKTLMWISREKKRLRLRNVIMSERNAIIAQFGGKLDELPAWVQFPDTERIEWVNKIIQQLWPYIGEYAKQFIHEFIEPQVRAQMPRPFKSFKFRGIDCGDLACRVGGLKVYTENVGRDKIIVDMDVVYAGDAEFSVQVCGMEGGINQLVLSGKIRCVLQPLLTHPPMIGGISGSFIELPKFDFNLTGMGEFVQLPGLINAIRSVINAQTSNICVLPNKIVVPLVPGVDVTKLYFPEPDGIIRLKIIEAANLENKDASMILRKDKSDPYCEIQVGSQLFKTRTINNDLDPVFNECFEAVVDQASGQRLRIELFDEDTTSTDEELGRLSIPLDMVQNSGVIDRWYHLEGCKHGELHLKVSWFDLSTNPDDLDADHDYNLDWFNADKPMHPALLMVFIDHVDDLPYPKANLEPSPFIEVTLGRIAQRTPVKVKTVNPLYQTKFLFFVKQPAGQELKLQAIDDGTRRGLGELSIPLEALMRQPNMELYQQSFQLTHGVHTSKVLLTARLRAFVPPSLDDDEAMVASTYGTDSHIERAERDASKSFKKNDVTQELRRKSEYQENGLAAATELGKMPNESGGLILPETQLNADNFQVLKRRNRNAPSTTSSGGSAGLPVTPNNESSAEKHSSSSSAALKIGNSNFFERLKANVKRNRESSGRTSIQSRNCGQLKISLQYDEEKFKLLVDIVCAKNLKPSSDSYNQLDSYVSAKLVAVDNTRPATAAKRKRRTNVVQNSLDPAFNSRLDFDIHYSEFKCYKLRLAVKDARNGGLLSKAEVLGQAELPLQSFSPKSTSFVNQWISLDAASGMKRTASFTSQRSATLKPHNQ